MANKREFKKYAEALGASACEAMMVTYYNQKDADKEAIEKAIAKVIAATAAAKSNADVTFDKGHKAFADLKEYSAAKKAFFKQLFVKINNDFNKEIDEAVKIFNAAIPESVKEEQKKEAAK